MTMFALNVSGLTIVDAVVNVELVVSRFVLTVHVPVRCHVVISADVLNT
jgi:hypothetical protein